MALDIIKVKHFYNKWGNVKQINKEGKEYTYYQITETIEEQLNKFLTDNKITPYEFIDIKYNEAFNNDSSTLEPSALLIYKDF